MYLSGSAVTLLLLGTSVLAAQVSSSEHPNKTIRGKKDSRQLKSSKQCKASKSSKATKSSEAFSDSSLTSAVFTMSKNASGGNEIIMYTRDEDTGELTLAPGSPFETGGNGGALESSRFIPLASQGPLIVSGNCLLAVNAGSDTVTTFKILSRRITKVSTVQSGGDVPVSIAANDNHGFVYVLNAGLEGSISGFTLDKATCSMKSIDDSTVSLLQSGTRSGNSRSSSPAQVDFTPNGEHLIVTIKGIDGNILVTIKGINGSDFGGGTINRFNVDSKTGLISDPPHVHETGVDSSIAPMGFDFDEEGNLLLVGWTENGISGSSLTVYKGVDSFDTDITRGDRVDLDQRGTGWVQYNNGCAFTANLFSFSISSVEVLECGNLNFDSISSVEVLEGGNLNLIDREPRPAFPAYPRELRFSSDGRFMYVISSTSGFFNILDAQHAIHVYETDSIERTCGLTEVQVISEGTRATGLAVF